jgi:hypothetical protein
MTTSGAGFRVGDTTKTAIGLARYRGRLYHVLCRRVTSSGEKLDLCFLDGTKVFKVDPRSVSWSARYEAPRLLADVVREHGEATHA